MEAKTHRPADGNMVFNDQQDQVKIQNRILAEFQINEMKSQRMLSGDSRKPTTKPPMNS